GALRTQLCGDSIRRLPAAAMRTLKFGLLPSGQASSFLMIVRRYFTSVKKHKKLCNMWITKELRGDGRGRGAEQQIPHRLKPLRNEILTLLTAIFSEMQEILPGCASFAPRGVACYDSAHLYRRGH